MNTRREHGGNCPGCNRIMSIREANEQGICNDCLEFFAQHFAEVFDDWREVWGDQ